jgi:hypothetical protein
MFIGIFGSLPVTRVAIARAPWGHVVVHPRLVQLHYGKDELIPVESA